MRKFRDSSAGFDCRSSRGCSAACRLNSDNLAVVWRSTLAWGLLAIVGCGQPEGRTIGGNDRNDRTSAESMMMDKLGPPPVVGPRAERTVSRGDPVADAQPRAAEENRRRLGGGAGQVPEPAEGLSADHVRSVQSGRYLFDPQFKHSGRPWQVADRRSVGELFEFNGQDTTGGSTHFWAPSEAGSPALWMHHVGARSAVSGAVDDYRLPDGFEAIPEAGQTEDGFPWRIRCQKDGALMGLVPAGPSHLGSEAHTQVERPSVQPILEGFYIDLVEVTVGQYRAYRAESGEKRRITEPARKTAVVDEPVTGISWTEAKAYASWARKELPTEAEWEKAARGPLGFVVPWGEGDPLWGRTREVLRLTAVAQYPADLSPYGLYDTAGNAREWVADWYQPDAFQQLLTQKGSALRDPTGPKAVGAEEQKVVKGGGEDWRLTKREGVVSNQRLPDVGFRCVVRLRTQGKMKPGPR